LKTYLPAPAECREPALCEQCAALCRDDRLISAWADRGNRWRWSMSRKPGIAHNRWLRTCLRSDYFFFGWFFLARDFFAFTFLFRFFGGGVGAALSGGWLAGTSNVQWRRSIQKWVS
jgi:hypothetical protein